jgi:hypothetical protein
MALRECGTCSGSAHKPALNALSSCAVSLTAAPSAAGPEWTHLFAAKCRQVPLRPAALLLQMCVLQDAPWKGNRSSN